MSSVALPLLGLLDRTSQGLRRRVVAIDRTRAMTVLALATVYLVWGSTYLGVEIAITVVPPFLLLAARFAIAGALLLAWTRRRGRPAHEPRITLRVWGRATVDGGLLLLLGTGLTVLAQTRLASGTTALLAASVPVWMALGARGMFGERLSPRAWLGLAVGLVGVGVLVDPRGGGDVIGMLLVVAAAIAWAFGSLRGRTTGPRVHPQVAAALEMLAASVLFAIVAVAVGEPARFVPGAVDLRIVAAFTYLTLAGSIVAFSAYRWLQVSVPTTLVGTYAYVNPAVAVTLGWLVLGERISTRMLLGGAVILVAVVLLVTGRPGQPIPAQVTSGGDVFAGTSRLRTARRRLGRLPGQARLFRDPHAPQYRDVGYPQDAPSCCSEPDRQAVGEPGCWRCAPVG